MKKKFALDQLESIVQEMILPQLDTYTIFALTGPLGAGKTTLTKEILKQCGVSQTITSPTFSYVQHYKNSDNVTFNHFDLYRITNLGAFIESGFDEYLYQKKTYNFIEWPEVIITLLKRPELKPHVCFITLSYPDASNPTLRMLEI